MSRSSASGKGCFSIHERTCLPHSASALTSLGSSLPSASAIFLSSPSAARNRRYASAVVAKPPGTRIPAADSPPIISPREAFLPPTLSRSVMRRSLSQETRIGLNILPMSQRRTVFFISDGTGITAQMLGHSLLTQFEDVEFDQVTL